MRVKYHWNAHEKSEMQVIWFEKLLVHNNQAAYQGPRHGSDHSVRQKNIIEVVTIKVGSVQTGKRQIEIIKDSQSTSSFYVKFRFKFLIVSD